MVPNNVRQLSKYKKVLRKVLKESSAHLEKSQMSVFAQARSEQRRPGLGVKFGAGVLEGRPYVRVAYVFLG